MKSLSKILLIEPDIIISREIISMLETEGYEITDVVPYLFKAVNSIDSNKPDLIIADVSVSEQLADFYSNYIKLPLIIISNQPIKDIMMYPSRLKILEIIKNPYDRIDVKLKTIEAFNKLNDF